MDANFLGLLQWTPTGGVYFGADYAGVGQDLQPSAANSPTGFFPEMDSKTVTMKREPSVVDYQHMDNQN